MAGEAGHEEAGQHSSEACDLELQCNVGPAMEVVDAGPVGLGEGLCHDQDEKGDDPTDASSGVQLGQQAPKPAPQRHLKVLPVYWQNVRQSTTESQSLLAGILIESSHMLRPCPMAWTR